MKKDIVNQYTYSSLIHEGMNREKHDNCWDNSSRSKNKEFTQTKNYEEANDFAVKGWDLGLEQYKILDGVAVNGSVDLTPSVAGCVPHVNNYLMGYPQDMYQLTDTREYNLPTLDIVVNLAYTASIEGSDALMFGKSIVAYINKMASTRNIRLTGVFASIQSNKVRVYDFITLKDFDSALVLNNIAFAFHPSFFRRIWFSVLEGKSYWDYGYGTTNHEYHKKALKYLSGAKSDELIIFKTLNRIDKYEWEEKDLKDITFDVSKL